MKKKSYLVESKKSILKTAGLFFLGNIIPTPTINAMLGNLYQERINSMYEECNIITNPINKKECQIKLLKYVMSEVEKRKNSNLLTPSQKSKLDKHINLYKMKLKKLSTINEAARFGKLKGFLTTGWFTAPIFGGVIQSRIEKAYYHCNDIKDKKQRKSCQITVLNTILSTLKSYQSKEPDNKKLKNKILDITTRIQQIKSSL